MNLASTWNTDELRDSGDVARWLAGGFQCLRSAARTPDSLEGLMAVLVRLSSDGAPTLPAGIVADLLRFVDDRHDSLRPRDVGFAHERSGILPPEVSRRHEDQVVGRLALDADFQRAVAAAGRFRGDERVAARAFLVDSFRRAVDQPGVLLSAAVVRGFAARSMPTLCRDWSTMPIPNDVVARLVADYERLRVAARATSRLIVSEDLFELERGLATRPFARRLALRQVLQAAELLVQSLPGRPPCAATQGDAAPIASAEESLFPTGGYASISTRGSIESLLHSQLALMDREERPDLFDARFARDELLYYSRDENQHFRHRRAFFIVFAPDLAAARFKDADAPFQRVVLALGAVVAVVRAWQRWLTDESLGIELVFPSVENGDPLAAERELLERALVLERERGVVSVESWSAARLEDEVRSAGRRARRRGLRLSTSESSGLTIDGVAFDEFVVAGPTPRFLSRGARNKDSTASLRSGIGEVVGDDDVWRTPGFTVTAWRTETERMAAAGL